MKKNDRAAAVIVPPKRKPKAKTIPVKRELPKIDVTTIGPKARAIAEEARATREMPDSAAFRKRSARAEKFAIEIPICEDPERRARLEQNDAEWLRFYFHNLFWYDFVPQQLEMIEVIGFAFAYGGDQSLAASRGEGKSSICRGLNIKYTVQGKCPFGVYLASTGPLAGDNLAAIKFMIETSDRLYADYPEVCHPIRCLENVSHRARFQKVSGYRHDTGEPYEEHPTAFSWTSDEVIFPHVPGSPSSGAIIMAKGLDSEVRGLNKFGVRPTIVIIDDPDTIDTARSADQSKKLEDRIDGSLAFLGDQQRGITRVIISTIQSEISCSFKFTDPQTKPSWNGKRMRFMMKQPDNMEMWNRYVELRRRNQVDGDKFAREAHQLYLDNREAMDSGAIVANPHRFDDRILPDKSRIEESAIQRYYNEVAKVGQEKVSTEWDNNPPTDADKMESLITPARVQRQVDGYPRGVIPPGCTVLTEGIDCHKRTLYYVVRAWRQNYDGYATGFTIDYGVQEVVLPEGSTEMKEAALDKALTNALRDRRDHVRENPYLTENGETVDSWMTLIDSMWRKDAVFEFCRESHGYYPGIGHGKSAGCAKINFNDPKVADDRIPGWHYFCNHSEQSGWVFHCEADFWKEWEQDRWMMEPDSPGSLVVFGEPSDNPKRMSPDEHGHFTYAHHICAEMQVEEVVRGVMKRYWKEMSHNNHYFDASYRANVAAVASGMRLYGCRESVSVTVENTQPARSPDGSPFLITERK